VASPAAVLGAAHWDGLRFAGGAWGNGGSDSVCGEGNLWHEAHWLGDLAAESSAMICNDTLNH
jgi:hypothetical protein